jgi:hypothetical protein
MLATISERMPSEKALDTEPDRQRVLQRARMFPVR